MCDRREVKINNTRKDEKDKNKQTSKDEMIHKQNRLKEEKRK